MSISLAFKRARISNTLTASNAGSILAYAGHLDESTVAAMMSALQSGA